MSDNGIGASDVDDRGEQLRHSQTRSAEAGGQPQRAEAGPLQRDHLVKRVLVQTISITGAGADLGEQRREVGGIGK